MCGKAGAGKSTLSKALARQHDALLVCEDVWLARLYPEELHDFNDYIEYPRRIKEVVAPMVIDMLARHSVVLDFPANTVQSRHWFQSIFQHANAAHTLDYMDASNSVCLSRIAKRNVDRPEGSHVLDEGTFMRITAMFEPPSSTEGFNILLHEQSS